MAADVALSHHERYDGRGYPRGLAGRDIPLAGRIVSVVDVYDAMTMERNYRPAMSDAQALGLMRIERGRSFDPQVLDVFLAHQDEFVALRQRVDAEQLGFSDLLDERG